MNFYYGPWIWIWSVAFVARFHDRDFWTDDVEDVDAPLDCSVFGLWSAIFFGLWTVIFFFGLWSARMTAVDDSLWIESVVSCDLGLDSDCCVFDYYYFFYFYLDGWKKLLLLCCSFCSSCCCLLYTSPSPRD